MIIVRSYPLSSSSSDLYIKLMIYYFMILESRYLLSFHDIVYQNTSREGIFTDVIEK